MLAAAGMGLENLVKVNHYLTRKEDIAGYREVRAKHARRPQAGIDLLVIPALAREEALVEVEAVAAK